MNPADRVLEASEGTVVHAAVVDTLVSTQATAVALLEQILTEELPLDTTLILARRQTGGRGRDGRTWLSPEGGLYLTWVRSCRKRAQLDCLPMLAAVAAADAVDFVAPGLVAIKWPNDLLITDRKLGGLLINARRGSRSWAAIGLGINLDRAPELESSGSRQADFLGRHVELPPWEEIAPLMAGRFADSLEHLVEQPVKGIDSWRRRLIHREGEAITARLADGTQLNGIFAGTTPDGHLLLDEDGRRHIVVSADVINWATN